MRYQIFNTFIDSLDINETTEKIIENIDKRNPIYQVSINASKINLIDEDSQLKDVISRADLVNADGMSIIWAAKILKIPIKYRVTGVDLFYKLLDVSEKKGYSVYFLGATEESIERMVSILKKNHPILKIAGYHNGYYKDSELIADEIKKANPDILFLGFSSPKKEIWIEKYQKKVNVPFIMGVGGSFDIYSGKTKRAPRIIQKIGMEWFYRFIQEPVRMYDRYIIGNTLFIKKVFKEKFK
ncbi:WecB/TagA/CpsF family glycosyltransferase [Lactococcus nasutitermitis]|uniref:WecB/TagA/CpsF family glycosyltransferase n=1 Tax=Lactococcus nasutitermitis TaxID=1652957 RepID=A0ABV9JEX1_9LACT|nr:WecB/TagA/CpsF family glycosyltransferase [Lactococcus nasutitermitis]